MFSLSGVQSATSRASQSHHLHLEPPERDLDAALGAGVIALGLPNLGDTFVHDSSFVCCICFNENHIQIE